MQKLKSQNGHSHSKLVKTEKKSEKAFIFRLSFWKLTKSQREKMPLCCIDSELNSSWLQLCDTGTQSVQ